MRQKVRVTRKLEKLQNKPSIVKCSHCKKILSSNEFQAHECTSELKGVKTIPVIDFLDTSCKGKKIITGQGTDGILYTFEVVPRKPIPITLPLADEKKHLFRTDEDVPVPFLALYKGGYSFSEHNSSR